VATKERSVGSMGGFKVEKKREKEKGEKWCEYDAVNPGGFDGTNSGVLFQKHAHRGKRDNWQPQEVQTWIKKKKGEKSKTRSV